MTEQEWLTCDDPGTMYSFMRDRAPPRRWLDWFKPALVRTSDRKLRLFACACCMRIIELIPTEPSRECVRVSERFADGLVQEQELEVAIAESMIACDAADWERRPWSREAINAVGRVHRSDAAGRIGVLGGAAKARALASCLTKGLSGESGCLIQSPDGLVLEEQSVRVEEAAEMKAQATLLRHIIGNPFRPLGTLAAWPAPVVTLAESIYQGADASFALHDALLESGQPEFATHFREAEHPKGCAWVDAILGKS